MTRVVLSIGSNLGDRVAQLRSVVVGLGAAVRAASPVYETDPWGGVDQGPFLNAVVIADDPALDAHGWLRRGREFEHAAERIRETHWGPRSLDVDVIACSDGSTQLSHHDDELTVPHPHAHRRAFVLIPWRDVDPAATLLLDGEARPLDTLLAELDAAERAGVRRTDWALAT